MTVAEAKKLHDEIVSEALKDKEDLKDLWQNRPAEWAGLVKVTMKLSAKGCRLIGKYKTDDGYEYFSSTILKAEEM